MQREHYYKPSGKANPLGLLVLFLATVVVGSALSILYLYIIQNDLDVRLCVLLTILLGGLMGALGGLICKFLKIRNLSVALIASVIGILIYTYFKWAAYVSYIFEGSFISSVTELLLDPSDLLSKIKLINEEGTWTFARGGDNVTGIILLIFWILEFLIYSVIQLVVICNWANDPFIEKDNNWAKKYNAVFNFRDFDLEADRAAIEKDPNLILAYFEQPENIVQTTYYEGELFHSKDFSENYFNVRKIKINPTKNSRTETKEIKYLSVSLDFVQNLFDKSGMTIPG